MCFSFDWPMFWKFGLTLYGLVLMFVCLFVKFFSLIWRRHHYKWRISNLTYTRHSWPFEHCSPTRSVTQGIRLQCRAFGSGAVNTCFYDLCLSRLGFEHLTFRMWGERSNRLRHYRGLVIMRLSPNYKNVDWLNYYMVFKVVSATFKPFNPR